MVKNKIRKSLFEQGQFLSNEYIKKASQSIQMSAIEKIDLKSSFNTLLYFPFRNEICIDIILDKLDRYSCSVYMPRIFTKSKMKFNLYNKNESLTKNVYGIDELRNKNYLDPSLFHTMFVPFVGVDINGKRLGYGGGYFDRALSNLKKNNNKPTIIGLGYEYQILKQNFGEDHDIKYDIVITETDIHFFS